MNAQAEPSPAADPLQAALARVRGAYRERGPLDYRQRMAALKALLDAVRARRDDIVAAVNADFGGEQGGRAPSETLSGEILPVAREIRYARAHLRQWMAPEPREVSWLFAPARARLLYQPLGVVGIVSPWNYPVQLALAPLVGAIAAGNRVLLKPSEHTPQTAALLRELVEGALTPEVASVVTGDAAVGAAFARLPLDHLLFTGSTAVGRQVMAAASENLTPVTLELGGKSPALVAPGYPLERAARRIMAGKLFNAGQTCIAPDYVLCPAEDVAALAEALGEAAASRYPTLRENPEYTAIINQRHLERLRGYLADAAARGARVIPLDPAGEDLSGGRKMAPALVLDPTDEMAVMREEIFGPVLPIVPYQSFEDAIRYVAARPRPLALYLFDKRKRRVKEALPRLVAGGVSVNDTLLHILQEDLPFGGVGPSGMGAYHGFAGFEQLSHRQPVFYQSPWSPLPALFYPPFRWLYRAVVRLLT